jgi:hypothetical protein
MRTTANQRRTRLTRFSVAASLVALALVAWIARTRDEAPPALSIDGESSRGQAPRATDRLQSPETKDAAPAQPELAIDVEPQAGRRELRREGNARIGVEVLVRRRQSLAPIPGAELVILDGEQSNSIFQRIVMRTGFDWTELRRAGRRAFADDHGRARLDCEPGPLILLALSSTDSGEDRYEIEPGTAEELTLDCDPMCFVRAQVFDSSGAAAGGVPVRLVQKDSRSTERCFSARTRAADGIAELGPIVQKSVWKLRVLGAFPALASVEVDTHAPPLAPIRLELPACGSLEVRLNYPGGARYAGDADIQLEPVDETIVFADRLRAWAAAGSASALFDHVGLGLDLRARVSIPGLSGSFATLGPGPKTEGERAVLALELEPAYTSFFGRLVDPEQTVIQGEIECIGAIQEGRGCTQFTQVVCIYDGGNFSLTLETRVVERASCTLLLHSRSERRPLGAVHSIVLTPGSHSLGTWVLEEPSLLASGRVVDSMGVLAPGMNVELVESDLPLGIGWALPSRSDDDGRFDLRGWSSESNLSILAGVRGAAVRQPILVARGATDVMLPLARPKSQKP